MFIELDVSAAQTSTDFETFVQLDGVEYLFRYIWRDRNASWYLNIYDQDENPLALGIRLTVNSVFMRRFRDTRLPSGLLFCADLNAAQPQLAQEISAQTDFGMRVTINYLTADDPLFA